MNAPDISLPGFKEQLPAEVLADCAGLCYPAGPGNTIDMLFGLAALTRSEQFRHRLSTALEAMCFTDESEFQLARHAIAVLDRLPADSRARLFSSPLAETDTAGHDPDELAGNGESRRLLSGIRHLVHHPDVRDIAFILPPCLFYQGVFYLPHIHALLLSGTEGTTIAVVEKQGKTRFVWSDGQSITLPNDGSGLPAGFRHPRLAALPRIGRFAILNGVPEVVPLLSSFDPAAGEEIKEGADRISLALELLEQIWPYAFHAIRRHVKAFCILKQRGYSRSHSPPELPGAILMSADDVERIGDLLCHESSHVRMNVFRLYDPIARAHDPKAEAAGFVSPWRPDLRPLKGLVDGVHAFLNVCRYHRKLGEWRDGAWIPGAIYERQKQNVIQANALLQRHAAPTRLGVMLMEEFIREEALL